MGFFNKVKRIAKRRARQARRHGTKIARRHGNKMLKNILVGGVGVATSSINPLFGAATVKITRGLLK